MAREETRGCIFCLQSSKYWVVLPPWLHKHASGYLHTVSQVSWFQNTAMPQSKLTVLTWLAWKHDSHVSKSFEFPLDAKSSLDSQVSKLKFRVSSYKKAAFFNIHHFKGYIWAQRNSFLYSKLFLNWFQLCIANKEPNCLIHVTQ